LLETLLGTPLIYQPAASADGRSLAFVSREARERVIYFAPLGGPARSLIRYGGDDGQELTQIALSRDGALLAYVRGGEPNSKGEIPNPRSLAVPPQRQIWLLRTDASDTPRLVGAGFAPQFSSDGARLIWFTERGVVSAPVSMNEGRSGDVDTAGAETVLAAPVSAPRFSPDGRRVAYQRASYIEVCDLYARVMWAIAKPANASDVDPTWSPDGGSIAFRRLFGTQPPNTYQGYTGEYVAQEPWAILEASTATHQVRDLARRARRRICLLRS
jgi:Tol biopolymer transport system component